MRTPLSTTVMTVLLVILIALLAYAALDVSYTLHPGGGPVLFEDGSFVVGQLAGCVPFQPCW